MKMIIKLGSILIAIWLISGCGSDNKTRDQYEENISNASTSSSSGSETSGWNSALLQTGQQVSYIPYDDGYYQIGAPRSFSRDDDQQIVTDEITGLMWQDDSDSRSYEDTWENAMQYCQDLTLSNYDDWRLPDIDELETLQDFGTVAYRYQNVSTTFTNFDQDYSDYWTSISSGDEAFSVFYMTMHVLLRDKNSSLNVRCVRGEWERPYTSESRYLKENGIVTDYRTDLMWEDQNHTKVVILWRDAIAYCESLTFGTYDDWRVPNINELRSSRVINDIGVVSTPFEYVGDNYISSTYNRRQNYQTLDAVSGLEGSWYANDKWPNGSVRCVRGGKSSVIASKLQEGAIIPVLATGQSVSYSQGDDGDYRLGVKPTFSRKDNIVSDESTGLMWQDDAASGLTSVTSSKAKNVCKGLTLGGYFDWRLPTLTELLSIADYGESPFLINHVFEANVTNKSGDYWSDKEYQAFSFFAGGDVDLWSVTGLVRCVRGAVCNSDKGERFFRKNNTLEDIQTGLTWQDEANYNNVQWEEAIDYCESLDLDGFSDWRLPNIKELYSIVDPTSTRTEHFYSDFRHITGYSYWSSTTYRASETTTMAYIIYHTGEIGAIRKKCNNEESFACLDTANIRCVRGSAKALNFSELNSTACMTETEDDEADDNISGSLIVEEGRTVIDYQALVRSNTELNADLYKHLNQSNENLFYSSFSLFSALSMTYAGAKGDTKSQMESVLHLDHNLSIHESFKSLLALTAVEANTYKIANSVWPQNGYGFSDDYLYTVQKAYGAQVNLENYESDANTAEKEINAWVKEETEGMITDLIPENTLDSFTKLVLVNALYFKGNWAIDFEESKTKEETFYLSDGSEIQTEMMHQQSEYYFYQNEEYKVLEIPYKNDEFSMYLFMPTEPSKMVNLESLLFEPGGYETIVAQLYPEFDLQLALPKFKFAWGSEDISKTFKALGMNDLFDSTVADLSGMIESGLNKGLYVKYLFHQAVIEVNEKGTEASAATAVVSVSDCSCPDPEFIADHPFIFMIVDNVSGMIIFTGKLENPLQE